jgi:glycosyltransferase involved in cell wall biosynthesis
MPTVSIVLPARDAESTLGMAIESCLAQTLPNFELILVDHGSIDGTFSVMKKYARRDSRIDVLKKPRSAPFVSVANLAWQESRGELIARMDADDFSYPARLQHQVRFLADHPDMAACGTLVRIRKRRTAESTSHTAPDQGYADYETWINSLVTPDDIAAQRFIDSPLANPTTLVRRSALERFGGYADPDWAEDYDLWLRMLEAGERLGKVEKVLLDWIDSDTRSTRTIDRYSQDQFQRAKAHYLARLPLVRQRGVSIAGAGPIGKKLARRLRDDHGITVGAFFEVSENRIGNAIDGIPVLPTEALAGSPHRVLVGAVGLPGARDLIRDLALANSYREGEDFFCVA